VVLKDGDNILFYNNLVYENFGGIWAYHGGTNIKIYNNTIYNNVGDWGVHVFDGLVGTQVGNNIVYNNTGEIYVDPTASGTIRFTNVTSDPSFANAGAHDFPLQASSAVIDVGTTIAVVPTGIEGNPRPKGAAYASGAYAYQGQGLQLPAPTNLTIRSMGGHVCAIEESDGLCHTQY
jgi:parallel beta-helix repeat protein